MVTAENHVVGKSTALANGEAETGDKIIENVALEDGSEPVTETAQKNIAPRKRERVPSRKIRECQEMDDKHFNKYCKKTTNQDTNQLLEAIKNPDDDKELDVCQLEEGPVEKVFCVCRKVASGIMIDCERCKDWFHTKCITYVCGNCEKETKHGNSCSEKVKLNQVIEKLQEANTILTENEVKLKKAKTSEETLKKKYSDELEASKTTIKELEKKLSMKNRSLDTMTVDCQKSQKELAGKKAMVEKLQAKISEKEIEIKDLAIENNTHKEAMKLLSEHGINTTISPVDDDGSSCNSDGNTKIELLQKQLDTEIDAHKKLKASHSAAMKEKNAEIRTNKAAIEVLQTKLLNAEGELNKVQVLLDASKLENRRLVDINDILTNKVKKGVSGDECPRNNQENADSICVSDHKEVVTEPETENDKNPGDKSADRTLIMEKNNMHDELVDQPICLNVFNEGKCNVPGCSRNHRTNLTKIKRGICVYEFSLKDSCTWGSRCMYTHDIPPEVLHDQNVIKEQQIKFNEVAVKKKNGIKRYRANDTSGKSQQEWHGSSNFSASRKGPGDRKSEESQLEKCPKDNKTTKPAKTLQKHTSHHRGSSNGNKSTANCNSYPVNSTNTSEKSFLELIRPMLMDQITSSVQHCMETHMNKLQEMMSTQLIYV